jgi:hypothetical protein
VPKRDISQPRALTARLSPGLSITAAQRRLDALVASLKKQYPADYPTQVAWTVHLIPLSESVVASVHQSLILLFGAVGLSSSSVASTSPIFCSPGPARAVVRSRFAWLWERSERASSEHC